MGKGVQSRWAYNAGNLQGNNRMIRIQASGVVYRNPKPHLRAVHTWHPSIVKLATGELVAAFDVGQGAESLDYHTVVVRSNDGGATWTEPVRLFEDPSPRVCSHTARLGLMSDGTITAFGSRAYQDDPEAGKVNRDNLGYAEMDLFILRSNNGGRSWEGPQVIDPPLVGPAFELCHRIIELKDGRWLAPTSTWRGWNGDEPNGMKAIALVSHDKGWSWPEYIDVIDRYADGIISWEQSIVQLPDGRLLAVAWLYDEKSGGTLPTPYAVSADGKTFGKPAETGLRGQTAKMIALPDGRVLTLYRRHDGKQGLWGNLSRLEGGKWVNLAEAPIWQGASSGMKGEGNRSDELSGLKFGFPSMVQLNDDEVLALFWCMEDDIQNIRWVRIKP